MADDLDREPGTSPVFDSLRSEHFRATSVDVGALIPCEHESWVWVESADAWVCELCGIPGPDLYPGAGDLEDPDDLDPDPPADGPPADLPWL